MFSVDAKVTDNSEKSIKPAARGSRRCFCRGEVLSMLTNCGWLMVYGDVDNPSDEKNGDVYVHKDDVVGDEAICPGDVVSFYLYVDHAGLGAEECRVVERFGGLSSRPLKENVSEPGPKTAEIGSECAELATWAMLFKRMSSGLKDISLDEDDDWYDESDVEEPCGSFSDEGQSDDETASGYEGKASDCEFGDDEAATLEKGLSQRFHNIMADTDNDEEHVAALVQDSSSFVNEMTIDKVPLDVIYEGKPWHVEGAPSDVSTSDGATSESESDSSSETASVGTPRKRASPWQMLFKSMGSVLKDASLNADDDWYDESAVVDAL